MMEEQVRRGREEIKLCKETEVRVKDALGNLGKDLEFPEVEGVKKSKRERDKVGEDRRVWETLEIEVGRT